MEITDLVPHRGLATSTGKCAICKNKIATGAVVYFDPTKSQGKHLVHADCWEALVEARRNDPPPESKKKQAKQVRSSENLAPPF